MRRAVLFCLVLSLGFLASLCSGIYKQNHSTAEKTDFYYGLPIAWHGEQGTIGSNDMSSWYSLENFAFDVMAWSVLFGIMALAFKRRR